MNSKVPNWHNKKLAYIRFHEQGTLIDPKITPLKGLPLKLPYECPSGFLIGPKYLSDYEVVKKK